MKGNVKFFNESKGFGFISGEDGKEYFVHLTGLAQGTSIREGDAVVFDIEQGDRGPKAANVKIAGPESDESESMDSESDDSEDIDSE